MSDKAVQVLSYLPPFLNPCEKNMQVPKEGFAMNHCARAVRLSVLGMADLLLFILGRTFLCALFYSPLNPIPLQSLMCPGISVLLYSGLFFGKKWVKT